MSPRRSALRGRAIADQPLPAKQRRSAATTERLLAAAEGLLREGGADAATLRAIASRAAVSLAIVYRRFPEKDAVLRAVYKRYFTHVLATNERALANPVLRSGSFEQLAASIVTGIAEGYRRDPALLRALVLYARTHPSAEFRARAAALNEHVFTGIRQLVESHPAGVSHPDPKRAVSFALAAVASVLADRILFSAEASLPSLPRRQLTAEATRLFITYLTA